MNTHGDWAISDWRVFHVHLSVCINQIRMVSAQLTDIFTFYLANGDSQQ